MSRGTTKRSLGLPYGDLLQQGRVARVGVTELKVTKYLITAERLIYEARGLEEAAATLGREVRDL